jgi:5-methylthioribose kinase
MQDARRGLAFDWRKDVTGTTTPAYRPFEPDSLRAWLAERPNLGALVGGPPSAWRISEVGDGNLNLVFLVEGEGPGLCVKQALPYVRLVGPEWPLPAERAFFEQAALIEHGRHVGKLVPRVHHYEPNLFCIVMERLSPHIVMRRGMIEAVRYPRFAEAISTYLANALFMTSDLAMSAGEKREKVALFARNTALCRITEDLVFTDPYRPHSRNRWTSPQLDVVKRDFERDTELKLAVSRLKGRFLHSAEALIHGDLHTGSIMVTEEDTRVIDPEFAVFGPMGFDLGAVIGNLLLNYFAQDGHETPDSPRAEYQDWVLQAVRGVWTEFEAKFLELWRTGNTGDLYPADLFADATDRQALDAERGRFMQQLLADTLGFGAAKMIRRILGLAHNIDLEWIADPDRRAACERRCLHLARVLLLAPGAYPTIDRVTEAALLTRATV